VEDQRRSGTFDVDILEDSLELYTLKHPKESFLTFLHCWQLVLNVPKWAEGCIVKCKKTPLLAKSSRQMAPGSESESDCVEVEIVATQAALVVGVGRMRVRPQDNSTAKGKHKNARIKDSSIRAQVVAIVQVAEAIKRKADILEDHNVLMLFIAPKTSIVSEAAKEHFGVKEANGVEEIEKKIGYKGGISSSASGTSKTEVQCISFTGAWLNSELRCGRSRPRRSRF
jgi:hypothetical protein